MKSRLWTAQTVGLTVTFLLLLIPYHLKAAGPELEVTNYGDKAPSTEEFIDALDPALRKKTRSISSEPPKMRSVSLGIQFKYDSYELTESAHDVLNSLGGALASPQLSEHKFMIEGHTDTTGSADYNQSLSEQRARSVKNYLVNVFGIDPVRLTEVGRGETALLDGSDPGGAANRRVQIINLEQ